MRLTLSLLMARRYRTTPRRNWRPFIMFSTWGLFFGGMIVASLIAQWTQDPAAVIEKLKSLGYGGTFLLVTLGPYFWWLQYRHPDEL